MRFLDKYFQPDPEHTFNNAPINWINQQRYVRFAGGAAFCLPVVMWIGGKFTCDLTALSQFYYDKYLGTVFVGLLFFVSALMLIYNGDNRRTALIATIGGIFAIGVAIFPTTGRGCFEDNTYDARVFSQAVFSEAADTTPKLPDYKDDGNNTGNELDPATLLVLFPYVEYLHMISTAGLLVVLILFCAVVFPRHLSETQRGVRQKKFRNSVYYTCAAFMTAAGLVLLLHNLTDGGIWNGKITEQQWREWRVVFWLETVILWGFGVSWMTKGRVSGLLRDPDEKAEVERARQMGCRDQAETNSS